MKASCNAITESYKHYRFKNERYKVSADLKEYNNIAKVFLKHLFKLIVTTGNAVELPSRLGVFVIEQYNVIAYNNRLKKKNKSVWNKDYNYSKEYEKAYGYKIVKEYENETTNNRMWTFSWLKSSKGTFKNKPLYSFNLVRTNVRSTSNKEYSIFSDRLCVHDFFLREGYLIYREMIPIKYKD